MKHPPGLVGGDRVVNLSPGRFLGYVEKGTFVGIQRGPGRRRPRWRRFQTLWKNRLIWENFVDRASGGR